MFKNGLTISLIFDRLRINKHFIKIMVNQIFQPPDDNHSNRLDGYI
jgi:hypothetical protein